MARIRTVKPGVFKHEDLFDAEQETGLPLRLCFIGLWTQCDREGRFAWRPRQLKTDILPYDDTDFSRVLDALATRGFVVKYACQGVVYGCIPSWHRHQVINNRETNSDLPSLEDEGVEVIEEPDACPTRAPRDTTLHKGKGREGKGIGKGKEGRVNARQSLIVQFEEWWKHYPHKVGKGAAERAFAKAIKITSLGTLIEGVEAYKRNKHPDIQWCYPAKWINERRWEDEPAANGSASTYRPRAGPVRTYAEIRAEQEAAK